MKNLQPTTYHSFKLKGFQSLNGLPPFGSPLPPTTYHPASSAGRLQPSRGFTLVEMLVSISVFMVVMTVAAGSLMSVIDANNKAQALKSAINNLNFAIESMAKEIRVGSNYSCVGACSEGVDNIKFLSSRDINKNSSIDDYVTYKLDSESIKRCVNTGGVCSATDFTQMTAKGVKIDSVRGLKFYIVGTNPARVLITISGEAGTKTKLKTKFNLQTTVSQRSF